MIAAAPNERLNPEIEAIHRNITAKLLGGKVLESESPDDLASDKLDVLANVERLTEAGEVGRHLIPYYLAAVEEEPRLQGCLLREDGSKPGSSTLRFFTESGKDEVKFSAAQGWDFYTDLLQSRETIEEVTKLMGLEPEAVDEKLLASLIFSHELGHIADGLRYETKEAYEHDRMAELHTIPRPLVGKTLEQNPEYADNYIRSRMDYYEPWGISDLSSLKRVQEEAYQNMPSERAADQFAIKVVQDVLAAT